MTLNPDGGEGKFPVDGGRQEGEKTKSRDSGIIQREISNQNPTGFKLTQNQEEIGDNVTNSEGIVISKQKRACNDVLDNTHMGHNQNQTNGLDIVMRESYLNQNQKNSPLTGFVLQARPPQ